MSSRKSRCSRKYNPCDAKDSLSINKALLVPRVYLFTGFASSLSSVLAQIVSILFLAGLSYSHNSYNIVAVANSVQPVVVVVVFVVVQLLYICKFFFEVVCSLIINYTELY
jgi:hypothetical protein